MVRPYNVRDLLADAAVAAGFVGVGQLGLHVGQRAPVDGRELGKLGRRALRSDGHARLAAGDRQADQYAGFLG